MAEPTPALPPIGLPPRPSSADSPHATGANRLPDDAGGYDEAVQEDGAVTLPGGFFRQPWVQEVLPFLTSLALHGAIVVIGVLFMVGAKTIQQLQPLEEQIIIPEAAMANDMAGGVENPGIGGDLTRPAAQDKNEENTHPDGWAPEAGESPVAETAGGGEGDAASLIGGGAGTFGRGAGFGSGDGDGSGNGSGTGKGRLAPFGAPGGGIPGPKGKVFGNGGNARTIAFCCDSSGSMIDKFSSLKQELAKAIGGLKAVQQFSIVFFADGKVLSFSGGTLVPATQDNMRKANRWLDDLVTSGTSDPVPGLELAFKSRPELMYVLTDGDFPNNSEVLKKVDQLNVGKKTRINTIAFAATAADETSESFITFLTSLAEKNGGKFRRVSQDQLE